MTLITTVPERLLIMALDSTPAIRDGSAYFMKTVDTIKRPFVFIEIQTGDYPPNSEGVEEATEEYTLELISSKYGQGAKDDAEQELRQVITDLLAYFRVRKQLQFSNTLKRQPKALATLDGVMWARFYMRQYVGVVQKGSDTEGAGPFWGTQLTVRVQEVFPAEEVIVVEE